MAGSRFVAFLVVALAVSAPVAVGSQSAEALGPLPSCDLGDVYTAPRGYDDWSVTLVDRMLRVEADYVPPDLVKLSEVGLPGGGYIRAVTVEDTKAMLKAARAAGAPIGIWSPYRSYKQQTQLFNGYVSQNGFDSAITYSQKPGHSEHQLGLGVDFMSAGGGNPLEGDWGKTPAGAWMAKNSWKYGWVLSYPRGKGGTRWNDRTCFRYEPWHYRFLGRDVAAKVHNSGLTIREYLWTHHTLVDRSGKPVAAPTPSTTGPTATPTSKPSSTSSTTSAPSTPSVSTSVVGPTVPAVAGDRTSAATSDGSATNVLVIGGLAVLALLGTVAALIRGRRSTNHSR